jgi:hypothetical protein
MHKYGVILANFCRIYGVNLSKMIHRYGVILANFCRIYGVIVERCAPINPASSDYYGCDVQRHAFPEKPHRLILRRVYNKSLNPF